MTSSVRRVVAARERGRLATAAILSELRAARLDRNVSGRAVADALGITTGQYSRLERGLTRGLTIEQAVVALTWSGWISRSVRSPGARRSAMPRTPR